MLAEQKNSGVYYKLSANHINHVPREEEVRSECHLASPSPSLPPSSLPITVIPIPVVTPSPTGTSPLPVATLSPPAALPPAAMQPCSPQPRPDLANSAVTTNHTQLVPTQPPRPQPVTQTNGTKLQQLAQQPLVQRYPGPMVSPPHLQALLPQADPVLQQAPLLNGPLSRGSPPDDGRHLDNKKRPGG